MSRRTARSFVALEKASPNSIAGMRPGGVPGGISPLVSSYDQWTFGTQSGAQLPRPQDLFTDGAFGPMTPINAMPIDMPNEASGEPDPRRTQYQVGWNMPVGIPGSEGIKLVNFQTLRGYADLASIPRACIDGRIREIVGLGFDIGPTKTAEKAMQGSDALRIDFEERRKELLSFFLDGPGPDRSYDSPYDTFESWYTSLLEDILVIDAAAIYLRPARKKGKGVMGSNIASLDLIDGSTVRPLYSLSGGRPPAPSPAYQQYIWGVPRVDLTTMILEEDLAALGEPFGRFSQSQMMYLRWHQRNWTPYGFSPLEKVILPAAISFARQQMQLEFFTEGSTPNLFVVPGSDLINTRRDIQMLQNSLNAIAGDTGWKQKIVVLPPNSKTETLKPYPQADQFDEWVTTQITMGWGYTPIDIGVAPKVAAMQSPAASKQMSQAASENSDDRWLVPFMLWQKSAIFNKIIQGYFGQHDMEVVFPGLQEGVDADAELNRHVTKIHNALESVDEARVALKHEPWGQPETSIPLVFTATGASPLGTQVAAAAATDEAAIHQTTAPPPTQGDDTPPEPQKPSGAEGSSSNGDQSVEDEADTPAHAAAVATQEPNKPATKILNELDLLKRLLNKGKALDEFEARDIPDEVMKSVAALLPHGIDTAIAHGVSMVEAARKRNRREQHVNAQIPVVASVLMDHAKQLRDGKSTVSTFVKETGAALLTAYLAVSTLATSEAAGDLGGSLLLSQSDLTASAHNRLASQIGWLQNLAGTIISMGLADKAISAIRSRLGLYGQSLRAHYEQTYGQTALKTAPKSVIKWHTLEDGVVCSLCEDRDGETYTSDTLPGWPGDGGFGELCEGGPNCRCTVTFEHPEGTVLDTGENTLRQMHGPFGQNEVATGTQKPWAPERREQWAANRETFANSLPSDVLPGETSSVQSRAQARDAIRLALSQATHVQPEDVPASAVAALVPSSQKSKTKPHTLYPMPIAAGVIVVRGDTGQILLDQRLITDQLEPGKWEFPGGHLKPGETARQGAVREWQEETGLTLEGGEFVASYRPSDKYVGFVYRIASPDASSTVTDTAKETAAES